MTDDEHKARHVALHRSLDELLADYLTHNRGKLPSTTTVYELLVWSHAQTFDPTPEPESIPAESIPREVLQ